MDKGGKMIINASFGDWDIKIKEREKTTQYGPVADLIIDSLAFCTDCEAEADNGETGVKIEIPLYSYNIKKLLKQLLEVL